VVSPSRRLAAGSKRRGLFAQSCWASTHSAIRVTRSVRGERPECFTYDGLAFATVGVTTRRFTGGSDAGALASVSSRAGSFDGPSNTQMEPTRPTVLCDPVTTARGSFATLYRRRKRRTSDHTASGFLRLLGVHRGVVLLRAAGVIRAARPTRTFRSRSWQQNDEEQRPLRSLGSFDHVGVRRRGSGLSRTAAPCHRHIGGRLARRSFDELGSLNVIARVDRRAGPHRFGMSAVVAVAPLCGLFAAPSSSRAFCLVRAHSSGGITTGCTRRRRASVIHMQAAVNRGRCRPSLAVRLSSPSGTLRASPCIDAICR